MSERPETMPPPPGVPPPQRVMHLLMTEADKWNDVSVGPTAERSHVTRPLNRL